jgi:hypothetical protein
MFYTLTFIYLKLSWGKWENGLKIDLIYKALWAPSGFRESCSYVNLVEKYCEISASSVKIMNQRNQQLFYAFWGFLLLKNGIRYHVR